jgi:hypothetical protein
MDKDLLEEIIAYIEKMEKDWEWERGDCKELQELIESGEMPELYYKLIKLRNN